MILFPLFVLFAFGNIFPAGLVVPAAITLSIVIPIIMTFGPILFDVRKTSIMKSLSMTSLNKTRIFIVFLMYSLGIVILSLGIVIFFAYLFTDILGIIETSMVYLAPDATLGEAMNFDVD